MIKFKKITLSADIMLRIVIVVGIMLTSLIVYIDHASRQLVLNTAKNLTEKEENAVLIKVSDFLKEVKYICKIANIVSSNDGIKNKSLENYMQSVVNAYDQVDYFEFKDQNNKIKILQLPQALHELKNSNQIIPDNANYLLSTSEKGEEKKVFLDTDLKVLNTPQIAYDILNIQPPLKKGWSDIVMQDDTPFIYYTDEAVESNQSFQITLGVNLKILSLILNNICLTDRTHIFIVDEYQNVIVDSDVVSHKHLKTIDQYNNIPLKTALQLDKSNTDKASKINFFNIENDSYFSIVTNLPKNMDLNWQIISIVPAQDFLKDFKNIEISVFVLSIAVIILIITFLYFQIQKLSEPISYFSIEANHITNLELEDPVSVDSKLHEIIELGQSLKQLKVSVNNFSKFIPKSLVKKFIESGKEVGIGGNLTELTIFFSDIANFTTISEQTSPNELTYQLSEYFEMMSTVILDNNGTIDKFIGDAIMAFWGAPNHDDQQINFACRTALICQQHLSTLNKYWISQNKHPFITRMGINAGPAVVGNIGSSERLNYTALGDSVNLASRLEGVNKNYGTHILISESVLKGLDKNFITRPIDIVAVKGKQKGVRIFELIGLDNDSYLYPISSDNKDYLKQFTEAFDLYLARQWKKALKILNNLQQISITQLNRNDPVVQLYIERCTEFMNNPPSDDWDGVNHLKEK